MLIPSQKEKKISYGSQSINNSDIFAVLDTLKSDFLTQGPLIEKFEKLLADYCGAKYAVAVSNGTAALHLACLALGLKRGDYHWTSPISFVASANCGIYCGSKPDFIDIEISDFNMSVSKLEEKLIAAKKKNKLPKIVIPVHFAGLPCDMPSIYYLSQKYGFHIIEDACHALGAEYKYKGTWYKIGSCKHSNISVFSFHPVKSITTGEGGAILTNDKNIYQKILMLRSHGIKKDNLKFQSLISKYSQPWYYEMQDLGFNYRITDIQCSLGISQLSRLEKFIVKRNEIAEYYKKNLVKLFGLQRGELKGSRSAYHLFVVLTPNRNELYGYLKQNNIICQVHYIPIYKQPYYKNNFKIDSVYFPNAEKYFSQCLSLPCYYEIKKADLRRIKTKISEFVNL